jgi:hypothetical protein
MEKIISIDVETNGLWGLPVAIAAVMYVNGKETDRIMYRRKIGSHTKSLVKNNTLLEIDTFEYTHDSISDMYIDFSMWWHENKKDAIVLYYFGKVVSRCLFRNLLESAFIDKSDVPHRPIYMSESLRFKNHASKSIDSFIKRNGLSIEDVGAYTNKPLYNAIAAITVYFELCWT